jgi:hypothetical protein
MMKKMLLVVAGLVLSTAAASQAGTLATAPALAAYPTLQTIYCDIVNLNTTPKNVTIDVIDYFGNVITTGSFESSRARAAVGDGSGQKVVSIHRGRQREEVPRDGRLRQRQNVTQSVPAQ